MKDNLQWPSERIFPDMIKTKKQHGGARKGSGRKKKEPTKTIRVPVSKVDEIKKLINSDCDHTALLWINSDWKYLCLDCGKTKI